MDTIFALATARGRAGVAVIRVSGPLARSASERMCGPLPLAGRSVRTMRRAGGDLVDQALILAFEHGKSFTGEEVVEFHLHGSIAVVTIVLSELGLMDGLREAEAGEFTRRALENGRLDLAQVEGLADLIDAETEAQQRQAVRVMSGALGDMAAAWREQLVRAAALVEATIDFADEDIPVDVFPEVQQILTRVRREMLTELNGVGIAERVRSGFEVAIVGPPNSGKSTLLNRLAGRDAAITSEYEGTTRDVLEVRMDLAGLPVTVLDTAGIRRASDHVEVIGIERGMERARSADLRVHLVPAGMRPQLQLEQDDIVLIPKDDDGILGARGISGRTGAGVDGLVSRIGDVLSRRASGAGVAIRERHRIALGEACAHINAAQDLIAVGDQSVDLLAEEVRSAIRAADSLVGRVDVEELLGEIFASFCIGK